MDAARAVINLGTYNLFIRSKDLNGKAEPGFGFYVVFQAGDTRNANLTDDDGKNNNGAFAGNILDRKYNVSPDMKLLTIHLVAVTPEHATAGIYTKNWQMPSL